MTDPPRTPTASNRCEPAWLAAVVGWLVAHALAGETPSPHLSPHPSNGSPAAQGRRVPAPWCPGVLPAEWGAERLSPRALRAWPGVGETRALTLARARWEHPDRGPPLYLTDVPGIGAGTERLVWDWIERP